MKHMEELLKRYPVLAECRQAMECAVSLMADCCRSNGKILVCGNGGSCSDSDHIVGELMKGFLLERQMDAKQAEHFRSVLGEGAERYIRCLQRGIPAIALPSQAAVLSAFANDADPELIYAQLVFGYARPKDLLICISTSGNAKNVVAAAEVAQALEIPVIALTGERDSNLTKRSTVCIRVPDHETYRIQELHLPVYHYLCAETEARLFS